MSTLTLTLIAVDRFVVILYPFRARMPLKTSVAMVAIINATAAVFTAPYVFHVGLVEAADSGGNGRRRWLCGETWSGGKRTAYGAFTNVTQFVLPFLTIILCYSVIIRRLNSRDVDPFRKKALGIL